jgi:uncharacterized membrane protein YfcA
MFTWSYLLLGLFAGLFAGFFGVGGGIILVPAMMLFFNVPYHIAVGTSLALIIPISLAGGFTHARMGGIDWKIFAACAITGALGAALGSTLVHKVPVLYARRAFALVLVYAAWRTWNR